MSRSYKKNGFGSCVIFHNQKDDRKIYSRTNRRKNKRILKECEKEYRDCEIFVPYKETCCLWHDVCDIDEEIWWCENPADYIINYDDTDYYECVDSNICIGCHFSTNSYKNDDGFHYVWHESADEKFINGIDYSLKYADKWSWSSDGGVWFQADILSLRKEFDEEVFGMHNKYHSIYAKSYDDTIFEEYLEYCEPGTRYFSDYFMIDCLFRRNVIPMTFKNKFELIDWLRDNEEKILKFWFKMRFKK